MVIALVLGGTAVWPAEPGADVAAGPVAGPIEPGSRIKDIASVTCGGGRQLIGYGLVVGLAGTGDSDKASFTAQTLRNLLDQMGLAMAGENLKVKNVAAVAVTAEVAPFAPVGSRFDATVSSLGDATSLQGGALLVTPLRGADGEICAFAQGPVSVGGFAAGGRGASETKNHLAVGRVPGGGWVTQQAARRLVTGNLLTLSLRQADFSTATRVASRISETLGANRARALDATTVQVEVWEDDPVLLMARLEDLRVTAEAPARVVINERTGTVVMGGDARVLPVAVAHGGLTVRVRQRMGVSQPPPLSGGETVVIKERSVAVEERDASLLPVGGEATLQDLVQALNALAVKPRDLIAIIQALKEAGALQAELVVM